jgi:hypothetical protein
MTSIKPSRVVSAITAGEVLTATGPIEARFRDDLAVSEFVFVRADGWSLAACGKFALAAFNSYRGDWIAVFEVMGDYQVVDAWDVGGFEERLGHYLNHARIAALPLAVALGDQVIEREPCDFCGWRPELEPSNVPDALVDAASCQCLPCRTVDAWHADIDEVHRECVAAQARGDHGAAGRFDEIERAMLDRAGECLALCEGRATT